MKIIRKSLTLSLLIISVSFHYCFSQTHNSKGCTLSAADTSKILIKKSIVSRGNNLPSRYSMEEFCPSPGNQGMVGSCSAWATAYAGLTIIKRIESGNKQGPVFSPYCLYSRVKALVDQEPCSDWKFRSN